MVVSPGGERVSGKPNLSYVTFYNDVVNPRAVMNLALNFFRELPLNGLRDCAPIEYFGCDLADVREVA